MVKEVAQIWVPQPRVSCGGVHFEEETFGAFLVAARYAFGQLDLRPIVTRFGCATIETLGGFAIASALLKLGQQHKGGHLPLVRGSLVQLFCFFSAAMALVP